MVIEYSTDPELIYEHFGKLVDMVIDGGYGEAVLLQLWIAPKIILNNS